MSLRSNNCFSTLPATQDRLERLVQAKENSRKVDTFINQFDDLQKSMKEVTAKVVGDAAETRDAFERYKNEVQFDLSAHFNETMDRHSSLEKELNELRERFDVVVSSIQEKFKETDVLIEDFCQNNTPRLQTGRIEELDTRVTILEKQLEEVLGKLAATASGVTPVQEKPTIVRAASRSIRPLELTGKK